MEPTTAAENGKPKLKLPAPLKPGEVWIRARQAIAEGVANSDGVHRCEAGEYMKMPIERAKAAGSLVEIIDGEPAREELLRQLSG